MARTYNRDSNGRFAGGGGSSSGGSAKVGRSGPRGGKVGTRAEQRRAASEQAARSRTFSSKATAGRDAREAYRAAASAARSSARGSSRNGIRPTGRLPRPVAGNGVRRTTGARRGPLAIKHNAIRAYTPSTPQGVMDQGLRRVGRTIKSFKTQQPRVRQLLSANDSLMLRVARRSARDISNRFNEGVKGRIARINLSSQGSALNNEGITVIRRRAARASAAAERGSSAGARAREIYGSQLAGMGPGKPGKASNAIRPGPRNTTGKPKKPRKPRTPKPPSNGEKPRDSSGSTKSKPKRKR
jgi:hypothetical protein